MLPLLRAALRPRQLLLLGAALALTGGVALSADHWLPGVLAGLGGGLAWALAVLRAARPRPEIETDRRLRMVHDAATRLQLALDGDSALHADARAACEALEARAEALAERAHTLRAAREELPGAGLQAELVELRKRAAAANDPVTAQKWREAVSRKDLQLRALVEVDAAIERIDAELAAVEARVGELHARLVAMPDPAMLTPPLRELDREMSAMERAASATLKELGRG